jgi:hypothetical protein
MVYFVNLKRRVVMDEQSSYPPDETGNDTGAAIREEILDAIADLEEYAAQGKAPPRCRGYRIRVNRDRYEIHEPTPTCETILETAGLTPVDQWTLRLKLRGGQPKLIEPGERVDLTQPGLEKFKALPRDQTEG